MKPVSKVLRLVDGDKKSTMDFLYETMQLTKDVLVDAAYISSKTYLKIIDDSWSNMFFHPLHETGKHFNMYIHIFHHYAYFFTELYVE